MHIKSITLDGFKSYGHRTEITGFDREFNAITGLNGSGKSNILDSICFVLGISNLSHVRAANLHELIYKNGQGSIKKATVSITFDNSNPNQSPVGFEQTPEITITRQITMDSKNKYMINGVTKNNKKVQDLFCSVQLNVNNPNFIVMQGKITKVLSMKANDILAMIEEAAGTHMYEVKKQVAQKTIAKKDAKLQELIGLLNDELTPKLKKAREERAQYVQYQQLEADLDNWIQVFQGWECLQVRQKAQRAAEALEEGKAKFADYENTILEHRNAIDENAQQIKEMTIKANKDGDGKLAEIEAELKAATTSQAKSNAHIKSLNDNIKAETIKHQQLEKTVKDDEKTLKQKENNLAKIKDHFETLKENDRLDNEALDKCERRYQALSAGKELNEAGEAESLREQLMHANEASSEAISMIKQSEIILNEARKQLAEKRTKRQSDAGESRQKQEEYDAAMAEIGRIEGQMKKVRFDGDELNRLRNDRVKLGNEVKPLKDQVENFMVQKSYTQFKYTDPEPNFNRNAVFGVVCRLFEVKEVRNCMALETAAGGKLYNVITDSDVTSKKLLQKGELTQRTTFIPMNKIRGNRISDSILKFAKDLVGPENVDSALNYITYNKRLNVVMEYIFGDVLICKNMDVARQVAFHNRIKRRCVTLDGDVVDPAGTLSGGAAPKGGSILQQLADIKKIEVMLEAKEHDIGRMQAKLAEIGAKEEQMLALSNQLKMAELKANMLKERLQLSSHYVQEEEIKALEAKIAELMAKIELNREKKREFGAKINDLQARISTSNTDDLIKEAERELATIRAKAAKSQELWQKKESDYEQFLLEIEEIKNAIVNTKEEIEAAEKVISELKQQLEDAENNAIEINKKVAEIKGRLAAEKEEAHRKNQNIRKKEKESEQLESKIAEIQLEIQEYKHTMTKLTNEAKHLKSKEADLFKRVNPKNLAAAEKLSADEGRDLEPRIRQTRDLKEKLARNVNTKAQSMFEQQEKDYNDLRKKLKIVEQDKRMILQAIEKLDQKKIEILDNAHAQISKDFGSIFGSLLPGANARLDAPLGRSILEGMEIKVALGGVWKPSLTELSGGQRSLAALSLILAMLLFKPAPLYILDEVDAALDLSHTQNIGKMLKTHFKKSQFIIVSLKDGMFNNANVLFRTQFVDGVSSINRTVNKN